jgi:hypothetical protein
VADGYDAMTANRPYQQALEPSKALTYIQSASGAVYDPKIVEAFVRMMGRYPVSTLVRLSTRELAVVVQPQEDPGRPLVRLVADADGTLYEDGEQIDLLEKDPITTAWACRSLPTPAKLPSSRAPEAPR